MSRNAQDALLLHGKFHVVSVGVPIEVCNMHGSRWFVKDGRRDYGRADFQKNGSSQTSSVQEANGVNGGHQA